jgi:hypothetical protein
MRRVAAVRLFVSQLICCCILLPTLASAQKLVDKQAILSQARQSYYNLHNEGLATFQCSVTPNWERILQGEGRHDAATIDATVKTLSQLRFATNVAADNSVKLTHNDLPGQSQQMKDALRQIYGGMEQMTSGFFDSWGLFMLSTPFPEINSKYQLDTIGPQYRLTYKEGTADVVTTMGRDFSITELRVTSPEFDSSLQPTFTKTPRGLVLRGYDASYQSQKPKETTRLKVLIDYQEVQGFQMLQKLNLSGTHDGTEFALEMVFSDCHVITKQH